AAEGHWLGRGATANPARPTWAGRSTWTAWRRCTTSRRSCASSAGGSGSAAKSSEPAGTTRTSGATKPADRAHAHASEVAFADGRIPERLDLASLFIGRDSVVEND